MSLRGVTTGNPSAPDGVLRRDRLLVALSALLGVAAVVLDWQRRQGGKAYVEFPARAGGRPLAGRTLTRPPAPRPPPVA